MLPTSPLAVTALDGVTQSFAYGLLTTSVTGGRGHTTKAYNDVWGRLHLWRPPDQICRLVGNFRTTPYQQRMTFINTFIDTIANANFNPHASAYRNPNLDTTADSTSPGREKPCPGTLRNQS